MRRTMQAAGPSTSIYITTMALALESAAQCFVDLDNWKFDQQLLEPNIYLAYLWVRQCCNYKEEES